MRRTLQTFFLLIAMPIAAHAAETRISQTSALLPKPDVKIPALSDCTRGSGTDSDSQFASHGIGSRPANRMAITFDDLPWVMNRNEAPVDLASNYASLIAAIKQSGIPVIGFVNDGKLYDQNTLRPERVRMLRDWLDAGFELGNHTAWHSDLHAVGVKNFEADISDGERNLKPMLAKRGLRLRWFRYPFLRTGRSLEDKAAIESFLHQHGYLNAPVTINSSEWIYALAYHNLVSNGADTEKLASVRQAYLDYMLSTLAYYEKKSYELLCYNVPQILLIHANELNAASFTELVALIRARDYQFVSLDEATKDPAYLRPDNYVGEFGKSWIFHWAKTENRPENFDFGATKTPEWIMELAGTTTGAE